MAPYAARLLNGRGRQCRVPQAAAYPFNATVVPARPVLQFLSLWPNGQGDAVTVLVAEPSHVVLDINGCFAL